MLYIVTVANDVISFNGNTFNSVGSFIPNNSLLFVSRVKTIDNRLYFAGSFDGTTTTNSKNIIYYDGNWNSMGITNYGNGWPHSMVLDVYELAGNLFIAGFFDSINTTPTAGLAYYNNNTWSALGNFAQEGIAINTFLGDLYVSQRNEIVKYDSTLSINDVSYRVDFEIYPNPCSDKITLRKTTDEPIRILLFDAVGRIVYDFELKDKTYLLDVTSNAQGVYYVSVFEHANNVFNNKVVIVR